MRGSVSLADLYRRHHEAVQFLHIYIREAHPSDGWWLGRGVSRFLVQRYAPKAALDVEDPKTLEARRAVAARCAQVLEHGIPIYVDDMDDRVCIAYNAKPTRLFLVGVDGKLVYRGGPGPYGFSPRALGEAIQQYLASRSQG
ncbi:hypothetical protein D6833_13455 [Candidatus Parcubacteria bacterium]|nr:MAG: hypothetical protein D6833_13455 [Candidatus Parcubacteria bacterium]